MLKKWFKDSESILLARATAALGVIAGIITFVEPSVLAPVIPNGWYPVLMVAYGLSAEWLRRRRDEAM